MQRQQLETLKQLQALEFSALEFVLYLNTHPHDQRALTDYSNLMREVQRLQQCYIANYGPLMAEDNVNKPCWQWIEEPWPWEIDY